MMMIAGGLAIGLAAVALSIAERKRPLRRPTQSEPERSAANLTLGAISMATVAMVETPLTRPLTERAVRTRTGLVQRLPLPVWARDAAAVLLMDYTIYLWHVATHKIPFLWRFHLVHHIDLDLDATTALRFHGIDMAISAPFRAAQVAAIGVSPRAFKIWQSWFFLAIVFHHSNVRLPHRLERILARFVTTPRMHGIHHSAVRRETDSNWSSGFSFWDHLHRTFRLDVPQSAIAIGLPAYRDGDALGLVASFALPFGQQRDAWSAAPVRKPTAIQ